MLYYFVIGLCLALLIAVIYFSAGPISMGIEARRNIKDKATDYNKIDEQDIEQNKKKELSDEIIKLSELKEKGLLTEEEFEHAKRKLLN